MFSRIKNSLEENSLDIDNTRLDISKFRSVENIQPKYWDKWE